MCVTFEQEWDTTTTGDDGRIQIKVHDDSFIVLASCKAEDVTAIAIRNGDEKDESGLPCGTAQTWTFKSEAYIRTFLGIVVQVIIVIDFRIGTIKRQKLLLLAVVSLVHTSLAALDLSHPRYCHL